MKLLSGSLLIISLLFSYTIKAQIGKINFEKTTYDFGKVKEETKLAVHNFKFTNVGNGDLKILNVRTSCGCTASEYSRSPIKPGASGTIKVTYHTSHRPGAFRKSITVTINNPDRPNAVLFIKGYVIPKKKSKADFYPITMGHLKLMTNHLAFNDIKTTEIKTDSLKIFNNWDKTMTISFEQIPPHLKVKMSPATLEAHHEGYIIITYNAPKKKDFGLVYDRIAIKTNDNIQPIKTLTISARISQDFSNLTKKELKKAPKIVFDNTSYNFGKVKSGTMVSYRFHFKNEGKKPLTILKIKTSCGCTTTKLAQRSFKKNKKGYIEVNFNSSGRKGRQHKTIKVISNDPKNPLIVLNISGELD